MKNNGLVLIIDDNKENLKVVGNLLSKNNYKLALANNGKDALKYLEKKKPDLILLDIMMPQIDGYTICSQIKADNRYQKIPIIFLTAKTEPEDIVKGFETGAIDYITKPFNSKELLARVKTHVNLKKANERIKKLEGIIPVCANCKKIRDENDEWISLEHYLDNHSEAELSHSLCPECAKKLYPQFVK